MKDITAKLIEVTGRSEEECEVINDILNSHTVIGHNNKEKFIHDFSEQLGLDYDEANKLYNQCAETIVKEIFHRG